MHHDPVGHMDHRPLQSIEQRLGLRLSWHRRQVQPVAHLQRPKAVAVETEVLLGVLSRPAPLTDAPAGRHQRPDELNLPVLLHDVSLVTRAWGGAWDAAWPPPW